MNWCAVRYLTFSNFLTLIPTLERFIQVDFNMLQRERTLLPAYKVRNKSNLFVDRRIGENDTFMDPEKKIALRLAAEKKRQFSKVSAYNVLPAHFCH